MKCFSIPEEAPLLMLVTIPFPLMLKVADALPIGGVQREDVLLRVAADLQFGGINKGKVSAPAEGGPRCGYITTYVKASLTSIWARHSAWRSLRNSNVSCIIRWRSGMLASQTWGTGLMRSGCRGSKSGASTSSRLRKTSSMCS